MAENRSHSPRRSGLRARAPKHGVTPLQPRFFRSRVARTTRWTCRSGRVSHGALLWQRHIKGRALVDGSLGPRFPAVAGDDASNDGESDAGSFEFLRGMESLKNTEELVGVSIVKS